LRNAPLITVAPVSAVAGQVESADEVRPRAGLSSGLATLMAVAGGAAVANLYYAQPLLHQVSRTFGSGSASTSLVVTCTQIGYATGLLLVVPLGDRFRRRSLTTVLFGSCAVALCLAAMAPTLIVFQACSVVIGVTSVGGQVLLPFAAGLSPADRRGRVVAHIMTGMLTGILLARTAAGAVAEIAGWRTIYWLAAGLMVAIAAALRYALAPEAPRPALPYGRLVVSALRLLATHPVLRRRALDGAAAFGAFSVLWTCLAFQLSAAPYHYSNAEIGLFGLAGLAGVLAANVAGRLADARLSKLATIASAVIVTASFGILAFGTTSLVLLVTGIVVLDMGVQAVQVTNQTAINHISDELRSQLTSGYMVGNFLGGGVGSLSAGLILEFGHWTGICLLGAGLGSVLILSACLDYLSDGGNPIRRSTAAMDSSARP
jgi:predicted MFS family arabinose efflux permease